MYKLIICIFLVGLLFFLKVNGNIQTIKYGKSSNILLIFTLLVVFFSFVIIKLLFQ